MIPTMILATASVTMQPTAKPQTTRKTCRRPLQFASPEKEQQYRAEMDHVQQYICAQVGGLDEHASQLLGVHDSRSRSYYEEIQVFLERKHQLEQTQTQSQSMLIRGLDEYLNELDPSLFVESAPTTPSRVTVANLPASSSYIRRKQEEARLSRLWHKYQGVEAERCTMTPLSCEGPLKRQRVM
ncbi:hypothetical protein BBO99_00007249 [Phytophthora kernoviae]|uniref:Uncharacterized protein n=2 Tax=Phytophthora kernoviae TaxID=325452 RepID=A0A421EYW3_9STRA|nr:hypothetical protein G195_010612 [Phytophthora kernoviae 00238/432]KAG2515811.1 hypothetical protein JM16_006788 [Phytophthora kernoviae]KAG2519239.1 hypothetical protein JM18_006685 [Phytophthora kernoviae]RLN10725.1 hypothetical protein BBI17_007212 [Phytophthora kernoviae]RLN76818.1 hypothetical protein BBO99_00007249 [Phytophthora kernoviae]